MFAAAHRPWSTRRELAPAIEGPTTSPTTSPTASPPPHLEARAAKERLRRARERLVEIDALALNGRKRARTA
jgi:hypothetical protein